jgi:hypothetical protein
MQGIAVDRRSVRFRARQKRRADLYTARPESEGGGDTAAIGDAAGCDHRDANGVHHLRDESHRADQPCPIALGKGSPVTARLEALRDDDVCTPTLEGLRLGNRRCRTQDNGSRLLYPLQQVGRRQTEMETDDPRFQFKQQLHLLFIKVRKRIAGFRHRAEAELIIVTGQTLSYATCYL